MSTAFDEDHWDDDLFCGCGDPMGWEHGGRSPGPMVVESWAGRPGNPNLVLLGRHEVGCVPPTAARQYEPLPDLDDLTPTNPMAVPDEVVYDSSLKPEPQKPEPCPRCYTGDSTLAHNYNRKTCRVRP